MSDPKTIARQVKLPLSKAIEISFRNMRVRFGRTLITVGGIVLGISFLMYVVGSEQILLALLENGPEELVDTLAVPGDEAKAQQIWLVTLSLLVAGVAISNAMLLAVTERYREIGTMKCLGALDNFVVKMFLMESAFQGMVGSLIGCFIGLVMSLLFALGKYGLVVFTVLPKGPLLSNAVLAVAAGLVISVISAIYPTYVAAKMVPADALRSEI
jgi:putative ABC transport system permease protein